MINKLLIILLSLVLNACSVKDGWFGESSSDQILPGKRLSILKLENNKFSQKENIKIDVIIPDSRELMIWGNSNGSQYNYPENISLKNSKDKPVEARLIPISRKSYYLTATPLIIDDKIIVMNGLGKIYAYSQQNLKKPLWVKTTTPRDEKEEVIGGGMVFDHGVLYVASGHKDVIAININSGKEIWRHSLNNIVRAAPVFSNNKLLVMTIDNKLYSLDPKSGNILWLHEGVETTVGIFGAASINASQDIVIMPDATGYLQALDSNSGTEIWRINLSNDKSNIGGFLLADIDVTPVINQNVIYIASNVGKIYAINLLDGQLLWEQVIKGVKSLWLAGNALYFTNSDNELLCLHKNDGQLIWHKNLTDFANKQKLKARSAFAGPVMANSKLWLATNSGKLLVICPLTGNVTAEHKIAGNTQLLPVMANGNIYLFNNNGILTIY